MYQQVLDLLRSTRPFLGPTGLTVSSAAVACLELVNSDVAVKTFSALASMGSINRILPAGADSDSVSGCPPGGIGNPYLLFLILMLLILGQTGISALDTLGLEEDSMIFEEEENIS